MFKKLVPRALAVVFTELPYSARVTVTCASPNVAGVMSAVSEIAEVDCDRSLYFVNLTLAPACDWFVVFTS